MKRLIVVCDGMADHPIRRLGGKTPLMQAKTAVMDRLAREGATGQLLTVPESLSPGSEVANMAIMGYDPETYFCQRGPLEAASMGLSLEDGQVALRCNLIFTREGRVASHSGGDLTGQEAAQIIKVLNRNLGSAQVRFYRGVHYRHLLLLSGSPSANIRCYPPHDHLGEEVESLQVAPLENADPPAEKTAALLNGLVRKSGDILSSVPLVAEKAARGERCPNMIWPWAPGVKPAFDTFKERTGLSGAAISAVDLIKGLSIFAGLKVIPVPGATGNYTTNYEGKAQAAVKALDQYDFVYLHVEAPDEAGHDGDLDLKIKVIEDIDSRLLMPIMKAMAGKEEEIRIALLPDHPTPVELRTHTREAVPVLFWGKGVDCDRVSVYNEQSVLEGSLGLMDNQLFFRKFYLMG